MKLIVDVHVQDLDRAVTFYTNTLGLVCRKREEEWASVIVGNAEIHLYKDGGVTDSVEFYVEDIDIKTKSLKEKGVEFVSGMNKPDAIEIDENLITKFPWGRISYFTDSEGNELALVEDSKEKPKFLYHASKNRNIELFEPRKESIRDVLEGPQVFATPDKGLATVFIVSTNDSWANSGVFNDVPYMIISDKERFLAEDTGGSIYSLPVEPFTNNPHKGLGELEWTSVEAVKPISKEDYESGLEAMIDSGVQVYFTDVATYKAIQNATDHGISLLNTLESENQHRGVNVVHLGAI